MKYLYWGAFWVLVTILPILVESKQQSQDEERPVRILSRKRRYLTFPEGSSFSVC